MEDLTTGVLLYLTKVMKVIVVVMMPRDAKIIETIAWVSDHLTKSICRSLQPGSQKLWAFVFIFTYHQSLQ